MARTFNTAGPCLPGRHYMLPPERRMPGVRDVIDEMQYFVIHAPRQTGKTTALQALAERLTEEGRYAAVLVSAEMGAAFPIDVGKAEDAVLTSWASDAAHQLPVELRPPAWPDAPEGSRVQAALAAWARACPRPLVVFVDEIDALRGNVLISALRQLRAGHRQRPTGFPWSVALVGLRDVRDYKVTEDSAGRLGTASPFNIKVESLTLANFTREEVAELYEQHTSETGQRWEPDAVERAFVQSGGQPWLVNALARELVKRVRPDRTQAIAAGDVDRAARMLIERQDTHLDSLSERLREPRVRAVIEPMLAGDVLGDLPRDDLRFVVDLGLVRWSEEGGLEVANPIYRGRMDRCVRVGDGRGHVLTPPRSSAPRATP